MDQSLWGTKEVASYLGVSERTALRLLSAGVIPGCRIGKLWRVSPAALERYVNDYHAPPAAALDYNHLATAD
jgi:excisionase family DNA binding protein